MGFQKLVKKGLRRFNLGSNIRALVFLSGSGGVAYRTFVLVSLLRTFVLVVLDHL